MISCKECGCTYDERRATCPKCGNPTKKSFIVSDKATCPCCGAEGEKVQGYNFVCEFCGTLFPVDARTRAAIDAQRRQKVMAQQQVINEEMKKKNKKTLKIIIFVLICLISLPFGINYCSRYQQQQKIAEMEREEAEEKAKAEQEKAKAEQEKKNTFQKCFIYPRDIFTSNSKDGIGHLNQNLRSFLMQKGFKEEGTEKYSYYDKSGKLIVSININTYYPTGYNPAKRLNENESIHSIKISFGESSDLDNKYVSTFKYELQRMGFANADININYKSFSAMSGLEFIRFGTQKTITENYWPQIYANWEGVDIGSYPNSIECVGYRELSTNRAKTPNRTKLTQKTAEASASAVDEATRQVMDIIGKAEEATNKAINDAMK